VSGISKELIACPEPKIATKSGTDSGKKAEKWFIDPEEAERIISAQPKLTWEQKMAQVDRSLGRSRAGR
jgi:hypothetical protein